MPRKKPFSVKQKKKQLQDKRERKRGQCGSQKRGRGSDSRTSGGRGVPASPLGGVGRGGGSAPTRVGDRRGDSLTPAPLHLEGVGKDGELGEGNPSSSYGAPSPQIPGGVPPPTHIREGPGQSRWEDLASKESGWCEEEPGQPWGGGVLWPLRAGQHWRHQLLPAGLQDGLRSSSNSRSGSRERREEQTDTSDGESVTHHIRRLNQQPSQGLGPRGYDPNR